MKKQRPKTTDDRLHKILDATIDRQLSESDSSSAASIVQWQRDAGFLLSVYGEHAKTVSDRIFGESEPNQTSAVWQREWIKLRLKEIDYLMLEEMRVILQEISDSST